MFLICMSCGFFAESDIVLNRSVSEPKSALALVSPMSPYQDEKPVEVSPKEERQDFDQASSVEPLVSKDQELALCSTGLAAVALSSLGLIVIGRTARSPSL